MKSTVLIVTIFIFFSQLSLAQPGFNIVHDLGLAKNHLKEMLVRNDTIIGYGLAQVQDSTGWRQGLLLVKFDSSGNFLQHKLLLDSLGDQFGIAEIWGEIISTSDGGFAMTAATFYRKSGFLIKLSNSFEVEFIKEYPDTVNLSNYYYKILETSDGFLLYGNIQRPNYKNNPFARRVDKTGETIWFKYFGNYNVTSGFNGGAIYHDSLYILVGGQEVASGSYRSFIEIINGEGEVVKSWTSAPWPDIGLLRNVIVLPNGEILVDGDFLAETNPFGTNLYNTALSRMDTNFQVLSTHYYGEPLPLTGGIRFWDFQPTPDGYFAGAGKGWLPDGSGNNAGWLIKFNEHGDSLWTQYVTAPFEDPIFDWHYLGGVGVLSSGNIVAGGEAVNGQQRYIWLVKVTPDGCLDTLWCNPVSVLVEEAKRETGLRVFPNPVSQVLHIEAANAFGEGMLRLLDFQGRTVLAQRLPSGSHQHSLDLSGIFPGVYFLQMLPYMGMPAQVKVVVTR